MKAQLEAAARMPVKTHKCAEKALRPLRKRDHQRRALYVFLTSNSSAADLLAFLRAAPHIPAKVIILCDRCRGQSLAMAEKLAAESQGMAKVARTWDEGVAAVAEAVPKANRKW